MLQQLVIVVFVLLKKYFLDILSHGAVIFIFFRNKMTSIYMKLNTRQG